MEELSAELLAKESADAVRLKLEDESRGKLSDSGQGGDAGVGDDAVSFMATLVGCWVLWHIPCVADRAVPRWQQQQHSCDRRVSVQIEQSPPKDLEILAPRNLKNNNGGIPSSNITCEQRESGKMGKYPSFLR